MARRKVIVQGHFPYFVTARCINREWFKIPLPEVWEIMSNYLYFVSFAFGFRIHGFVLMSNHFHLIVSTPLLNLSPGMNYFMREVSKTITARAGRINQTFGGPYYPCVLATNSYYFNAYKYLYRNPVRAGLVDRCENWPYSTLRGLLGQESLLIPVVDDTILFDESDDFSALKWLNHAHLEDEKETAWGLKRAEFRFRRHRISHKPVRSDDFIF